MNYCKEEIKRIRRKNAISLPKDLENKEIPKYIVYYKECYNKEQALYREFFKIEKHPNMQKNKVYVSSKSNKIHILEKYEQIKKILNDLNKTINANQNLSCNNDESAHHINSAETILYQNETISHNNDFIENKVLLPKYYSIKTDKLDSNKYYLIYDKKENEERISMKKTYYFDSESLQNNFNNFVSLLKERNHI
jgi:hypothetical protein